MSAKSRGTAFERKVRHQLEAAHYFVVRSAASLGPVDLIAMCPGEVLFVQAKSRDRLDPGEWNELMACAEQAGAVPVLVVKVLRGEPEWYRLTERKEGGRRSTFLREPFVLEGALR